MSFRDRLAAKAQQLHQGSFKHEFLRCVELDAVTTDQGRYYTSPTGFKLPSVTTVLGTVADHSWLDEWKLRVGEEEAERISGRARARGTALHNLLESYLKNEEVDLSKAMPQNAAAFRSIAQQVKDHVEVVRGVEHPLWSTRLRTAGRTDLLATWDGTLSIIDWKTASRPKNPCDILGYFLQSTTYGLMVEERYPGVKVPQIVIGIAVEHDEPQFFVRNKSDYVEEVLRIFITERTGTKI